MTFTVTGISGLNIRTAMQVEAVDVQGAEVQAALHYPNIRIAGVFAGTPERVDTRASTEPALYEEQAPYAPDELQPTDDLAESGVKLAIA